MGLIIPHVISSSMLGDELLQQAARLACPRHAGGGVGGLRDLLRPPKRGRQNRVRDGEPVR